MNPTIIASLIAFLGAGVSTIITLVLGSYRIERISAKIAKNNR